jgi:hypothetical protein
MQKEAFNLTINLTDAFLTSIGSTLFTDVMFTFLSSPISLLGFVLNALSFFTFHQITKNSNNNLTMYRYLKLYCGNSGLLCFLLMFSVYSYSTRFFGLKFNLFARIYRCVIISYVTSTLYFFGNIMDTIISIERLSIFIPKFQILKKYSTILIGGLVMLLCSVVNLPSMLRYYVKSDQEVLNDLVHQTFSFCGKGILFNNDLLLILNIFIRDVLTLILELFFAALSCYFYHKFQVKKNRIRVIETKQDQTPNQSSDTKSKKIKEDRDFTLMVIYLSMLSVLCHLVVFVTFVYFILHNGSMLNLMASISIFLNALKHMLNFFIFYRFDRNFRSFLINLKQKLF